MKGQLRHDPAWLDAFFQRADEIFVSFSGGDYPYVLPLNFVWLDGRIYLHCGFTGRKLDLLRQDGRVGFAAALDVTIVRERSTTWYKSVSGCGHIRIVEDTEEKRRALDALSLRYAARCPRPAPEAMLRRVNVLCIDVENISGKERTPS
ncbi:pyridoxamine 5'-phosphate oxidase family protein [uncultured Desulfovibrio sp.]|uniref:pyridoxamine 5'-phosphate oxidase family protein n=1 Tax=uncultured Desulfovibrio sp. TaxID=167968 RepID=UPI002634BB5A|nr:pyridoxamine 5'-phosphate oxidase family protein [uncultured Desulfovibrio sp.]